MDVPARQMVAAILVLLGPPALGCRGRPAPASPPAPSASARELRGESSPPGAEAVAGGQRCSTPCALRLEPGRYRLLLRKAGYFPFETDVELGAASEERVSASLVSSH